MFAWLAEILCVLVGVAPALLRELVFVSVPRSSFLFSNVVRKAGRFSAPFSGTVPCAKLTRGTPTEAGIWRTVEYRKTV